MTVMRRALSAGTALIMTGGLAAAPASAGARSRPSEHLRRLAGERIVYSYPGLTPPASLLAHIRRGEAAGVIFFGENIHSIAQIKGVVDELQAANRQSRVHAPLLMMTDQEGGVVRRLKPGEPVLSAKQMGASADPVAAAREGGAGAARTLRSADMNVNLAPVLDVFREPGNFIDQFGRSFSSDADVVSRLSSTFIRAQQRLGPAATAKHFPGLGAAPRGANTDLQPVTLHLTRHEIRHVDEHPYTRSIRSGVKLVMSSWATYPALDPSRPAGLSPRIVQGELRKRLGFHGVTITDALEAGALQAFGGPGARGVAAARAGQDLLLYSARDVSQGSEGLDAVASAIRSGKLRRTGAEAAARRVLRLRRSLG